MKKHVSLALHLWNGFTDRPLAGISALSFVLNDEKMPITPLYKEGGWCVLINLAKGKHRLWVSSNIFFPLEIDFDLPDEDAYVEKYFTLSPTANYPFGKQVDKQELTLTQKSRPFANETIYVLPDSDASLKIAQDGLLAGAEEIRLYASKKLGAFSLPGRFLLEDGKNSELVTIKSEEGGSYRLSQPLFRPHARGVPLKRVGESRTDENGRVLLIFDKSSNKHFYLQKGKEYVGYTAQLSAGNAAVMQI